MLIDFRQLFPKYNIKPKGVLHVGANVGEERDVYLELGIKYQIWIEANPEIYEKLKLNISGNPLAFAHNYCIGDEHDVHVKFHISSNASQSSSILELGTHATVHPDVTFVKDITVVMKRLDILFGTHGLRECDFLNIDLQGAELKALKGMGNQLHDFKWAYIEVNQAYLYRDCPLVDEIDSYLAPFGFKRVETKWAGNTNWGDALYVKN